MSRKNKADTTTGLEIGVIGMAGRFPNAENLAEFWNNLKNGVEAISFFSDEELDRLGVKSDLSNNPDYVRSNGAVLEDREFFDADFFSYSPREAEVMDPQVRIFHECVWEALESAGYNPETYPGAIGLYAGCSPNFNWETVNIITGKSSKLGDFQASNLINRDYLTTRIAYKLNLKGPALFVQTACSTSLVAIHVACRSLLTGECKIALAGGVSLKSLNRIGYLYQAGMINSPDGHCRAFDEKARGTNGGDGSGVVVLKLLKNALADGDYIHAVIKGTAINNDGLRKVGFTAPSVKGQAEVIKMAQRFGRIEPESITYVEAHGTGTPLGDPVEMEALNKAFNTEKKGFCAVGAVKTNMGHLDAAAGIAGFLKTVLAIKHRLIPPTLHFEMPNRKIDFENTPFYVNKTLKSWENNEYPLRAGVSSFGIGGTNAHVVLEEAPGAAEKRAITKSRGYQLILMSARTESSLNRMTQNLADHLKQNPDINLADAAYTMQVGRKEFQCRRTLVCADTAEAMSALTSPTSRKTNTYISNEKYRPIIFMFPGLGGQYVNMGLELYQKEPEFRREMDRCFEILNPILGIHIKNILYPGEAPTASDSQHQSAADEEKINRFDIAQAVVFSFEYALAKLIMTWGIEPEAMIGYSFGEYTAAHISGVLSLEDALKLVVSRGKSIKELASGAMLSVPMPVAEVQPLLEKNLSIAIDNGSSCIVAGPAGAVGGFEKKMKEKRYLCMRLQTSHAIHSVVVEPILETLKEKAARIGLNKPAIPYISNVTGTWITADETTSPQYWADHLRNTVQFAEGIKELVKKEDAIFLEIGPGRDLCAMVERYFTDLTGCHALNLTRAPRQTVSDISYLLNKIGQLWGYGKSIDWDRFNSVEKRFRISLPTYPFERINFGLGQHPRKIIADALSKGPSTSVPGDFENWFYIPSWERSLLGPHHTADGETGRRVRLVFIRNTPFAGRVVKHLKLEGYHVVTVTAGSEFNKPGNSEYTVDPRDPDHYYKLFDDLGNGGVIPGKIFHLWQVDEINRKTLSVESVKDAQDLGFYSLLYMAKAIVKQQFPDEIDVTVITNNMLGVAGEEVLCPQKATVLGPLNVIPQEHPGIKCRCVDIVLPEPGGVQEELLIHRLLEEFSVRTNDKVTAYRDNHRWVQVFLPMPPDKSEDNIHLSREGGVYLITGGLGDIGFVLAEYLAEKVKGKLVLIGRSSLPVREEWDQWSASHKEDDPIRKRIERLRRLEERDVEYLVLNADVADREQMQKAIERTEERFGEINGVIHGAGIVEGKSIDLVNKIEKIECERQFHSKVYGTLILEELLRNKKLDFCWLLSSVSSVLGGLRFVAYSAANNFMDAFTACLNRSDRLKWISVNWETMGKEEIVKAFQRSLCPGKSDQVVIAVGGNLETRIKQWIKLESEQEESLTGYEPSHNVHARPNLNNDYAAPGTRYENEILDIWQNLFGFESIGVTDDFFELGGDSLKAITIISRLHKKFDVAMELTEFFERPTVEGLAEYIESAEKSKYYSIEPVEKKEYYRLSSAQKRLYALHEIDDTSTRYNMSFIMRFESKIDKDRVEYAFKELIRRHAGFRTSFVVIEDEPVQRIHETVDFALDYFEVKSLPEANKVILNYYKSFNLCCPPLLRGGLIKGGEEKYALLIDMHHIVSDGVSMRVFTEELRNLYAGEELPELTLQYTDFSEWQSELSEAGIIAKQAEYWLNRFKGDIPVLCMPLDYPRPTVYTADGGSIYFGIDKETAAELKRLALETETTLYMVMLASYYILLSKYARQEDIIVGSPAAGRRHLDLDNIIGLFINMLPMRNQPGGEKTFVEFLAEVKGNALNAYENQDFQFEDLVWNLKLKTEPGRNPLFDAVFAFQNTGIGEVQADDSDESSHLNSALGGVEMKKTHHEILLNVDEMGDRLSLLLQYSSELYKESTARKMTRHYVEILDQIIKDRDIKLEDINISHELIAAAGEVFQEESSDFRF